MRKPQVQEARSRVPSRKTQQRGASQAKHAQIAEARPKSLAQEDSKCAAKRAPGALSGAFEALLNFRYI